MSPQFIAPKGKLGPGKEFIVPSSLATPHEIVVSGDESTHWCIWNQIEATYWKDMVTGDCLKFPTCEAAENHVAHLAAEFMESGEEFDPSIAECVQTEDI